MEKKLSRKYKIYNVKYITSITNCNVTDTINLKLEIQSGWYYYIKHNM